MWGGSSGYTYTFKQVPNGTTDVDVVIVREGKNAKGRILGLVLATVGKGVLGKAFGECQSDRGPQQRSARFMSGVRKQRAELVHRSMGSIIRGVAASAVGTLAMDASLYRGYRHDGGNGAFPDWESSEGLMSWEDAPAPALVAKRLLEGVLKHEVSPRYARLLNNVTHWGFGLATGAGYGLLGARRTPKVWFGLPFGAAVWAGGYVVFPLLGVYQPIWKYDLETLRKDLSVHLVFGTATAAAFCLLTHRVDK